MTRKTKCDSTPVLSIKTDCSIGRCYGPAGAALLMVALLVGGCGLGFLPPELPPIPINVVIENGTSAIVEVRITSSASAIIGDDGGANDSGVLASPNGSLSNEAVVRVGPGSTTTGALLCDRHLLLSARLLGDNPETVLLTGDGTGTIGFDSGSVGEEGERLLVAGIDFSCVDTVVIQIGGADSAAVAVVTPGGDLPDPLPPVANPNGDPSSVPRPNEIVRFRLDNPTTSFVQFKFGTGGDQNDPQFFSVRVPPLTATDGVVDCSAEFILEADHLEDADSADGAGFHTVVLLGAGSGAPGFDENNVGLDNSRTLLLDVHFSCGDTIQVTVTRTKNTIDPETEVTTFGIGEGTVAVTPAEG